MSVIDAQGETHRDQSSAAYNQLLERLGALSDLNSALALLEWDQETKMPEEGASSRSTAYATLSSIAHDLHTSKETLGLLEAAEREQAGADPDSDQAALLREARLDFESSTKLPADFIAEYARIQAGAQRVWVKARSGSNFDLFKPDLERIFAMARRKAEYLGYEEHPYDALLNEFEPGITTALLRGILADLKDRLVPLLAKIKKSRVVIEDKILRKTYSEDKQLAFCKELLEKMGVDSGRSRLDAAAHAFTAPISSPFDVRVTTRCIRDYLNSGVFGSIHEGGHALFELGVDRKFARTPLAQIKSMGLHESQSLLWENMIGRSREFWTYQFPLLQQRFPNQLLHERLETFYCAINKVNSSCIRLEADEVTYCLHIILRFELEVDLIEGTIKVADLPRFWNDRFEAMFGVRPSSDAEGVLQDVHWSGGAIGYFPAYDLGKIISAQLLAQAKIEIPNLMDSIASGNYAPLREWLATNVHQYGRKYSTAQLVRRITGREITCDDFISYLEEKYGELYSLSL
jgi:carboxypeptidase Taq